jgi:hypothetical protein
MNVVGDKSQNVGNTLMLQRKIPKLYLDKYSLAAGYQEGKRQSLTAFAGSLQLAYKPFKV